MLPKGTSGAMGTALGKVEKRLGGFTINLLQNVSDER